MTDKVDAKGYFILEKHVVVNFILKEITSVNLVEFMQGCILDSLNISRTSDAFELLIESSYGFHGSLSARYVVIEYHPGET